MTSPAGGFERIERCFACDRSAMTPVGRFQYLVEQADFVPPEWMWWCHEPATLVRCPTCGSQGPWRRPDRALLGAWYARQSYAVSELFTNGHAQAWLRLRDLPIRALVDVGCGPGTFLDRFAPPVRAVGLEPSLASVGYARDRGRQVFSPDAAGWSSELPDAVDAITLFDVIEHLGDPGAFLRSLAGHLLPGGRLAIFTGDAGTAWARRWGVRWWYHGWAGHLSCFSAEGLVGLLRALGLAIESVDHMAYVDTPIQWTPRGLLRAARGAPLRIAARAGVLRRLDQLQPPTAGSPLGIDHMLVIARAC